MTAVARRRWLVLSGIGLAVVGLHMVALLALGPGWLDPEGPVASPMQRIELRSVVQPGAVTALPPPAAAALPVESRRAARMAATGVPGMPAVSSPRVAVVGAQDDRDTAAAAPSAPPEFLAEPAGPAVAATATEIPVYATRLPPAGQWRYRLQRGLMVGEAELQWAPQDGARYEMRLLGRFAGVTLLEWASQGQLDAAGVAPERLAIRRRGRDRQAVNFQREAGKITFSGPTHELPLWPGVQDRLSWMVQLPAVVAAAPERFAAGATVVLYVAGARGDADIWAFVVQGVETVDDRPALKLLREPRRRYDTRAEVWLDPSEHYLPLRVVQTPSGGGAALELQRERVAR